ncbi:hypothetical protein PFLUV_G00015760 [Perca fluviatilis]|uniref:Uncharacterized protein n=1 Tax=Perca fluviatilis TaxID=8168 RepID=A0A6A5FNZ0_PERFL|nr:hypothetical protein PFLUV_G00015760 [Perca fluviatilis]
MREFDVEGVADPRLEVKGQRAEPVWSSQLSPDSACFEGSAGSLEQPHDAADTDSLSQGSSVGSLGLEDDDDDANSLKNHFETLTDEKFDTDLRLLQPPEEAEEEKHYLNPRLSISTRFLSRFQDRIRAWPSRAPPPVSMPTRISEESSVSNVSVSSGVEVSSTDSTPKDDSSSSVVKSSRSVLRRRASCAISHQPLHRPIRRRHSVVVVQCRETLRDITSRTPSSVASAAQQGAPRLGYLGTTASSRAKLSQDAPPSGPEEEEKENLADLQPAAPQQELTARSEAQVPLRRPSWLPAAPAALCSQHALGVHWWSQPLLTERLTGSDITAGVCTESLQAPCDEDSHPTEPISMERGAEGAGPEC